ncbi:MAG TPA: OB-fold domain-containing protein, partial [Pseudomonadales bacterium]|nr:OB-fold domain-containing protein [Pseudomonadales bacterium]
PACKRCVFPPQPACPHCRSLERGWRRSSGRGKVYSWVTVHRASHPWFADRIPYAAVLVEMEEGFRVVGSIDCAPERLHEGMLVEAGFEDVNEQISLLRFRTVEADS